MKWMAFLFSALTTLGIVSPTTAQDYDSGDSPQLYSQTNSPQLHSQSQSGQSNYQSSQSEPRLGDLVRQRLAELRQRDIGQQQAGYRQQPQQGSASWEQSSDGQQSPLRQRLQQRLAQLGEELQPGQIVEIAARLTDEPIVERVQGENAVVAPLRTRLGQEILACFGRPEELRDLDLQRNFAVLITGQVQEIEGQPVIIVQEVRQLSRPKRITRHPHAMQQQAQTTSRQIGQL